MTNEQHDELFNTGLSKIRHEIKSRLASHGLYGMVVSRDVETTPPGGLDIEVTVKSRTAHRLFERQQIEASHLRVKGEVLAAIIAMVDELAA